MAEVHPPPSDTCRDTRDRDANKRQTGFAYAQSVSPRCELDSPESLAIWNEILKSGLQTLPKLKCIKTDTRDGVSGHVSGSKKLLATDSIREAAVPVANLTKNYLLKKTGVAPHDTSGDGLEQAVSDAGVGHNEVSEEGEQREQDPDSRNFLAKSVNDLQDWNGGWIPAPADWEGDRLLCRDFVPDFIRKWAKEIPVVSSEVDIAAPEYRTGRCSVSLTTFVEPPKHPDAFPDMERSEHMGKQLNQTAEIESMRKIRKLAKKKRHAAELNAVAEQTLQTISHQIPETNPNSPTIPVYLRPASKGDVHGITEIMNHYIMNSIITEDQEEVSEADIENFLSKICNGSLPFIVAIQGSLPQYGKNMANEHVLGFAYAEGFFGIRNTVGDSSRYTAVLRFYVHPQYIRKNIGRSLLDRLLEVTTRTHASNMAYDWVNTNNDPIYNNHGGDGPRRFHQVLIERRIERKNDPDFCWMKEWLRCRYFFEQVGLFRSTARTRRHGAYGRFLDVVYFQYEAASELEFDPFV